MDRRSNLLYIVILGAALLAQGLGRGWFFDPRDISGPREVSLILTNVIEPFGRLWTTILLAWLVLSLWFSDRKFDARVAIHSFVGAWFFTAYALLVTISSPPALGVFLPWVDSLTNVGLIAAPLMTLWWMGLMWKRYQRVRREKSVPGTA